METPRDEGYLTLMQCGQLLCLFVGVTVKMLGAEAPGALESVLPLFGTMFVMEMDAVARGRER